MELTVEQSGTIPALEELRARNQWVAWRYEDRHGKQTKPPFNPRNGRPASHAKSSDWVSHREAVQSIPKFNFSGVGFVLSRSDPYCFVDLDHCRDPDSGKVEPWALAIVDRLASYTEISPSETGLHIFVKAILPAGKRKVGIEIYPHSRYATVTGNHLEGSPFTIENRQNELEKLYREIAGKIESDSPEGLDQRKQFATPELSDEEIIAKAEEARNGDKFKRLFYDGLTDGYSSPSEGDAAMASILSFYSRDAVQIERVMRRSALKREKWDANLSYLRRTIEFSLDKSGEIYSGRTGSVNPSPSKRVYSTTDSGNVERLADIEEENLRFDHDRQRWMRNDGPRWKEDKTGSIFEMIKQTNRKIFEEAAAIEDETRRKTHIRWGITSESNRTIRANEQLARSHEKFACLSSDFDKEPWLFNVANGTIDLRAGELQPHRKADMISKISPVTFDPKADCPRWKVHLEFCLPDPRVRDYHQKYHGYAMTPHTNDQSFILNHGEGNNGKSTTSDMINFVMGDYARVADIASFIGQEKDIADKPRSDLVRLQGARCVFANEPNIKGRINPSFLKTTTGDEEITVREMYGRTFSYSPTFKVLIATNHLPQISDDSEGMWRRVRLIQWTRKIPPEKKDRFFLEKLKAEASGILNWLIEGCLKWRQEGLDPPQAVLAATEEYRAEQDGVSEFISDCCVCVRDARVTRAKLRTAYESWCEETDADPVGVRAFTAKLREMGLRETRTANSRWWNGLGLKE